MLVTCVFFRTVYRSFTFNIDLHVVDKFWHHRCTYSLEPICWFKLLSLSPRKNFKAVYTVPEVRLKNTLNEERTLKAKIHGRARASPKKERTNLAAVRTDQLTEWEVG